MEIKNDKFEISKSSWVYKLLSWTGMTKWDEPQEACTLALMLSWRLVLVTALVINFFWGWIYTLSGSMSVDDGFMIGVVIISWFELLLLFLFGIACLVEYVGKRFEKCKQTCPRVRWTEDWEKDNG